MSLRSPKGLRRLTPPRIPRAELTPTFTSVRRPTIRHTSQHHPATRRPPRRTATRVCKAHPVQQELPVPVPVQVDPTTTAERTPALDIGAVVTPRADMAPPVDTSPSRPPMSTTCSRAIPASNCQREPPTTQRDKFQQEPLIIRRVTCRLEPRTTQRVRCPMVRLTTQLARFRQVPLTIPPAAIRLEPLITQPDKCPTEPPTIHKDHPSPQVSHQAPPSCPLEELCLREPFTIHRRRKSPPQAWDWVS